MEVTFENGPAFTVAVVKMAPGEQLRSEGGAMLSMTTGTQIETSTQGGILKGLKRSLSGESFFMNTFTAAPAGSEMVLAHSLPGDMSYIDQQGDTWLYHRDGFVACEMGIDLDTKWGGLKGAFGASSFFVVKCSGRGKVIFATYGALRRVDLQAGMKPCRSTCTRSAASSRSCSPARASSSRSRDRAPSSPRPGARAPSSAGSCRTCPRAATEAPRYDRPGAGST
jgi:uncharacterized protein (TIGR00266 family)